MASGYVWGLDIGQCGLKALRAKAGADGMIEADSFDFIEYPQMLSQPEANPVELIREALKTFLSRNDLRGDEVAISLPGQSGLSKFVKLPPVGLKELPKMVQYEAKGQIPFDLEEVVWDYQRMPGEYGATADEEDDDLPMQTEVGLFAIKRDQLFRAIRPLVDASIEIDLIQMTPMALYNMLSYDQLKGDEEYSDDKGEHWIAGLSMGTESSDLVITNGYRVWQRSIPIGGNHFTKQLLQDLKLTFAKAELLKRNAKASADAKQLFKSMRPVFTDLLTEAQRSIGYFGSLERAASVERLVLMGNAAKLPGLTQYLGKSLDIPVDKLRGFERLTGPATEDSKFKDNLMAFPVCYGLALQGLDKSQLNSNLVPREIVRSRIIKRKKPWVAAIAASLMMACAFNFFFNYKGWSQVHEDHAVDGVTWKDAEGAVTSLVTSTSGAESADNTSMEELARLNGLGNETVGSDDGRRLWLEMLKTVTDCLPIDPKALNAKGEPATLKERPLAQRKEIYIDQIESQYFTELTVWNSEAVKAKYEEFLKERAAAIEAEKRAAAKPAEGEEGDEVVEDDVPDADGIEVETVEFDEEGGWVIQISGHHYQRKGRTKDKQYIRQTLLEQLEAGSVKLPMPNGRSQSFTAKEMGIFSPILLSGKVDKEVKIPNPDYRPPKRDPAAAANPFANPFGGAADAAAGEDKPEKNDPDNVPFITGEQYTFVVQFVWKQIPLTQRLQNREAAKAAAEEL